MNNLDNPDNNETKWKTKTFSKENNNIVENLKTISENQVNNHENKDENNETEIIIQKIKKINKKKKHTNYKNIEELDNIYEEPKEEIKREKNKNEKTEENKDNFEDITENLTDNETKEGFKEELSNSKCKKNAISNIFSKIRSFIDKINNMLFGKIDKIVMKIVTAMYDLGDKKAKSKKNDINVIKKQVYYILSIPIALWVTYNWFFITIYKQGGAKINTKLELDSIESFLPMLRFFFYYLYLPTALFAKFVLHYIPMAIDLGKKFEPFNVLLNCMILFLLMILIMSFMICKYSPKIKNAFFGYIGGSANVIPSLTGMFYAIILFSMLMSFFPSGVLSTASNLFNLVTAPVSTIFGGLVKLIFTLINISIAGIFLLGYIIIHSFFAIFIYSTATTKITIQMIHDYLHQCIQGIGKYDCPPNTLEGWVAILKFSLEIMYKCLYEFIVIMFLFIGLITYLIKVKSKINKGFFSAINAIIIFCISGYAYGSKIRKLLEEMKTP
jgi:hypothetical protein